MHIEDPEVSALRIALNRPSNENEAMIRRLKALPVELSLKQYAVLLDLFHEVNEVFETMPTRYREAFFKMLHTRQR